MMSHKPKRTTPNAPPAKSREDPPPPRKTSHGIRCTCGSDDVRIVNTRTRAYPPHLNRRISLKRRECICRTCTRRWWTPRTRVTEEEVSRGK